MANKVLTIVYQEAEQAIDSAIAAAVNEIHNLGHSVKEVRIMGDSGEAKVALNTVEGIAKEVLDGPPATSAPSKSTPPPVDTPAETPVTAPTADTTSTGAPVDEPVLTAKQQKEQELLDELAALRQEPDEEADPTGTAAADQSQVSGSGTSETAPPA